MGNTVPVRLKVQNCCLQASLCLLITAGWEAEPSVSISRAGPKVNTSAGPSQSLVIFPPLSLLSTSAFTDLRTKYTDALGPV